MDGLISLLMLLLLAMIVGAVLGYMAFARVNTLRDRVDALTDELAALKSAAPGVDTSQPEPDKPQAEDNSWSKTFPEPDITPEPVAASVSGPDFIERFRQHLIDNWMIWLGGISVALAGIFMVKYSINMGLLGPKAQISMAIVTGLALHGVADWLRRRQGSSDPVFAALAGGASITLYAALLAALHIYQLIEAGWTFALLAVVSLMTMLLALVHGPMLAMIGLVGAYVVPIFVSTGSGNIFAAMVYSLIISGAGLLLLRYVSKSWLWWSVLAGVLGWWLISLTTTQAEGFRGIYLAIAGWLLLAVPSFDWLLQRKANHPWLLADNPSISTTIGLISMNQLGMVLLILAWGVSIVWQGQSAVNAALWAPMVLLACVAGAGREHLKALAWFSLLVQWLAWYLLATGSGQQAAAFQLAPMADTVHTPFLIYAALMAVLYSAASGWQWFTQGFSHLTVSLLVLSPLLWLALSYLLVNGLEQSLTWSIITLVTGLLYGLVAAWRIERDKRDHVGLWSILAAHVAYSLAVALYFREASLTLALAAQLVSLCWLKRRYELPWLEWLVKALLTVVVIRLTLNPWLAAYPVDVHWSLWVYGGSTVFAWLASRYCEAGSNLRAWLEAATLHLLVMTLGAELRYWLYDGRIFVDRYDLVEAAINSALWTGLALTYYHRARFSASLASLYRVCSRVLLTMALASYGVVALIHNPWWSGELISATPVFNILLLAYGVPVLLAVLVAYYHQPELRSYAMRFAGGATLLFVSLEIRQLWQGADLSLDRFTPDGELYTYSVVWMLMAIAGVLAGTRWQYKALYKAGMALLAVVIAKIFLIDMSGLDGLWRVAAFMGLGLAMLALAWFYKRMQAGINSQL